jgi:hypothetical protein
MPELKDFCRLADGTGVTQVNGRLTYDHPNLVKATVIDNTTAAPALRYVTNYK